MSRWKTAASAAKTATGSSREPAGAISTSVHKPGLCDIAYDPSGKYIVTCGVEGNVRVWDAGVAGKQHADIPVSQQKKPITAAVVSPNGSFLAAGSEDHSVKLYTFPDCDFVSIVMRFSLPVRTLAFNSTGSILAAGGDAESVKLVTIPDCSTVCNVKGHEGQVCSLAFDPEGHYLLSADTNGTIVVWDVVSTKAVHTLRYLAPRTMATSPLRNRVGWHPNGSLFAAPGLSSDVVLYKRKTAEVLCNLKGGHMADVGVIAWSPNGKYLASAGEDRQVLVWHVEERQDLGRLRSTDMAVSGLSWSPEDNAVALIGMDGKYRTWGHPIPAHMPSPTEGALPRPNSSAVDRKKLMMFGESEETEKGEDDNEDGEEGDDEEEDEEEGGEIPANLSDEEDEEDRNKERRRQHRTSIERDEGDKSDNEDSDASKAHFSRKSKIPTEKVDLEIGGHGKSKKVDKDAKDAKGKRGGGFTYPTKPQEPFQPCSTQKIDGRKRFLAYNLLGSITIREDDGYSSVEVEFHDTSTHTARVPVMTDYFGFTMAALGDKGCVFANPWKSEKHVSTLFYRPFNSWAPRSEWSMQFPAEEEVRAVALGQCWAAATTSLNYLRVFSEAGMQRFVMSLAGPVVALAGHEKLLAVVYHGGQPTIAGDQVLEFVMYDISEQKRVSMGRVALSPSSTLTWLGFTEAGLLSTYDSKGVLRVLFDIYDGSWVPVFSSVGERKSNEEAHWVVGLNETQLFCIVCKLPEAQPQVMPRPVLSVLKLAIPLAHLNGGSVVLEEEYLRSTLVLSQVRARADQAAAEGKEDAEVEERILKMETEQDRCLLRLIAAACKADKLVRALELGTLLTLHKSLEGAIRIVNSMRLPALAERLGMMVEERLEKEKAEAAAASINPLGAVGLAGTLSHALMGNPLIKAEMTRLSPAVGLTPRMQSDFPSLPSGPDSPLHRGRANGGGAFPSATRSSSDTCHRPNDGAARTTVPPVDETASPKQPESSDHGAVLIGNGNPGSVKESGKVVGNSTAVGNVGNIASSSKAAMTVRDKKDANEEEESKGRMQSTGGKEDSIQENASVDGFGSPVSSFLKPSNPFAKRVGTSLGTDEAPSTSGSTPSILDSVKKMQAAKEEETGKRKLIIPAASAPDRPGKVRKTKRP